MKNTVAQIGMGMMLTGFFLFFVANVINSSRTNQWLNLPFTKIDVNKREHKIYVAAFIIGAIGVIIMMIES